jgi:5'-deoxynucleotidase YfbR-like HD superfamily hydrolase
VLFVASLIAEMREFNATLASNANLTFMHDALEQAIQDIESATQFVIEQSQQNPDEINAAAVDYLHAFGLLNFAYMFAKMSKAADGKDDTCSMPINYVWHNSLSTRMLPELTSRVASR